MRERNPPTFGESVTTLADAMQFSSLYRCCTNYAGACTRKIRATSFGISNYAAATREFRTNGAIGFIRCSNCNK